MRDTTIDKKIRQILEENYIESILLQRDQLDINFLNVGFKVGTSDIKSIEGLGFKFDSISTYGNSGIALLFTR